MTYQEMQERLTKVETLIQAVQQPRYQNKVQNVQETLTQLNTIKENLENKMKILAEAEGIITTDNEAQAEKLASKGHNVNLKTVKEAPEGMYYIKIPRDAASQNKAQVIFNDLHGIKYEINDDPDGIVMYFKKEDFNAGVIDDLEGDGVQIIDTNIPEMNEEKIEVDGDTEFTLKLNHLLDKHVSEVLDEMLEQEEEEDYDADQAQRDDEEDEERGYHQGLPLGEGDKHHDEGDLDLGHQDDEPHMLKKEVYDIAVYAAKLYKQLKKYDAMENEVDFPHWWQRKVTLAREYMSKAQHYLEFEEKQPALDAMALEEEINERSSVLDDIIHDIRVHGEESGDVQGTAAEYIFNIANAFDINLNDIKDYLFEEEGPAELDKIYDVILKYVKDPDEAQEELDNFISQGKDGFSDELYANLSRDPEFRLALKETVEMMIQKKKLNEAEATCCHRCGRKHVKGTACKKPYLKKSDPRHCANK